MKKGVLAILVIASLFVSMNSGAVLAVTVQDVLAPGMNFTYKGTTSYNQTEAFVFIQTLSPSTNPVLLNYTATITAFNTTGDADLNITVTSLLSDNEVNTTQSMTLAMNMDAIGVFKQGLWDGSQVVWNNQTGSYHDSQTETDNSNETLKYTTDYFPDYEDILSDMGDEEMEDTSDMPQPMADFFESYEPEVTMDSSLSTESFYINDETHVIDLENIHFSSLTNYSDSGTFDLQTEDGVIHDVPYLFYFYNNFDGIFGYDTDTGMLITYDLNIHSEVSFIMNLFDSNTDVSIVAGMASIVKQNMHLHLLTHSALYGNEPEETTTDTTTTNSTSPVNPLPGFDYTVTILTVSIMAIIPVIRKKH